jgi:hypothetical protein
MMRNHVAHVFRIWDLLFEYVQFTGYEKAFEDVEPAL